MGSVMKVYKKQKCIQTNTIIKKYKLQIHEKSNQLINPSMDTKLHHWLQEMLLYKLSDLDLAQNRHFEFDLQSLHSILLPFAGTKSSNSFPHTHTDYPPM